MVIFVTSTLFTVMAQKASTPFALAALILVFPILTPVTTPFSSTVAMVSSSLVQRTA